MSGISELRTRRDVLIKKCTQPEFSQAVSCQIGKALQSIIDVEAKVVNQTPELYQVPDRATLDLSPTLDEQVRGEIERAWKKRLREENPNRFVTILAYSRKQPDTWMKFDTSVSLLRAGSATLHLLELSGVHLPLRIKVIGTEATILPKPSEISDKMFVDLVMTLSRAFADERVDAMTDGELSKTITQQQSFAQAQESLPLYLLTNAPSQFCEQIDGRDFAVIPHRLMTEVETKQWSDMAAQVIQANRKGQDIVVGQKGRGSYNRIRGEVNLATGLTLHSNFINPDDKESPTQTTEFLVSVLDPQRSDSVALGSTICNITPYPQSRELFVQFHHSASDLFFFNQRNMSQ